MGVSVSERKERHSSRFLKAPWQQYIENFKFDENSRQGEADCIGDNLLPLWQEYHRLIALPHTLAHTRTCTQIALYSFIRAAV